MIGSIEFEFRPQTRFRGVLKSTESCSLEAIDTESVTVDVQKSIEADDATCSCSYKIIYM